MNTTSSTGRALNVGISCSGSRWFANVAQEWLPAGSGMICSGRALALAGKSVALKKFFAPLVVVMIVEEGKLRGKLRAEVRWLAKPD